MNTFLSFEFWVEFFSHQQQPLTTQHNKPNITLLRFTFCSFLFVSILFLVTFPILVSLMESKVLRATITYKPSTPFSSFHLTTRPSFFSFQPIAFFPQKFNLSVKAHAASSIGSVLHTFNFSIFGVIVTISILHLSSF